MTKDIRTVPHRAATAEEEDSIPTHLRLGPAWTKIYDFLSKPGFLSIHIFLTAHRFLYIYCAIKTELLRLNIATGCTKIFEDLF